MGPAEVAAILFGVFALLIILRVPVAFALGLACVPVFFIDHRLTPFLLLNEMLKSYNSFLLLAIPFFMLAANLINTAGITEKLINLSRALVGHLPGGLGHVSVLVSMLFAGMSGSSTAEAAGVGGVLVPAMKKQGYGTPFTVSLMVAVYIYAKRRNYPVYARVTMKEFLSACGQAILPILTPAIIVGGIVFGFFTPTEASVIAVLY